MTLLCPDADGNSLAAESGPINGNGFETAILHTSDLKFYS